MLRQGFLAFKTVKQYRNLFIILREFSKHNYRQQFNDCNAVFITGHFSSTKEPIVNIFGLSVFSWLGLSKEEEHNDEDDLIMNIKRSILFIQRKELDKAEQMLHLALRLAQQTQNQNGITYVYDVMANLAMERGQFKKAEQLFVSVMQRLITSGIPEDNIKNIHISLKLARICDLKGDLDKAGIGYKWTLDKLKERGNDLTADEELLMAITKDWYAHYLITIKSYKDALTMLTESYEISKKFEEGHEEQIIILLNDMATVCEILEDYNKAEEYLKEATTRGRYMKDMDDLGAIFVNLGRIYIKKGLYEKARMSCGYGWKLGTMKKNEECVEQANSCLQEVKKLT